MPELPEVETVKRVLLPIVRGRRIENIDVLRSSAVIGSPGEFVNSLLGKTFLDIERKGKFLLFHLDDNTVLISHLRMEGKYFELEEKESNTPYCRVVFHLDNGRKLCYDDSRTFGKMKISTEADYLLEKEIARLGPEPMQVKEVGFLLERCRRSSLPIKSTLLDQTLLSGIGNIYADETLYASHIHPLIPASKITREEWERIISNASRIMKHSIEEGGSTIRSYHPGKGIDGNFQVSIRAYGKGGEKCPECGSIFRYMKVNGRGTTFCPCCQEKRYAPIRVAVYGKIASGKSTFTALLRNGGFKTISSDEIVARLYRKSEVALKIGKTFGLPFRRNVDKKVLREYLVLHPEKKKALERIVHPLVLKEIAKFQKNSRNPITVAEVPLLFESHAEGMFDILIGIDVSPEIQEERLKARNGLLADQLAFIAMNNAFDKNKNRADFIVDNSSDPASLVKKAIDIIGKLRSRLN